VLFVVPFFGLSSAEHQRGPIKHATSNASTWNVGQRNEVGKGRTCYTRGESAFPSTASINGRGPLAQCNTQMDAKATPCTVHKVLTGMLDRQICPPHGVQDRPKCLPTAAYGTDKQVCQRESKVCSGVPASIRLPARFRRCGCGSLHRAC
jgi:hypothetical protein